VIDRLQVLKGGAPFNNMLADVRGPASARVDFAAHAEAMGAWTEHVGSLEDLEGALDRARRADRTAVLVIRTDPHAWTGGDAWWDVGVPEVSDRDEVLVAKAEHEAARKQQRTGV
jgi:3D-(3,5/4)-trihydroxycyclohexane-1,2-dione acylhydrolase (decyclizing)